ncbi:hypothetical protein GCM10009665_48450 [Kitasatospora nipponensis]|uniref:RHS repeat-associated protein n=1 Tax=Kitasatospora nipponensis TaxID=258049 RepID=A0ABN1WJT2_9ACTN
MSNQIVRALEDGARKLGKALAEDAGKTVKDFYHSAGAKLKTVAKRTAETDAEHEGALKKILQDGRNDEPHEPHLPGEGGGGGPGGKGGGGADGAGAGRKQAANPREAGRTDDAVCEGGEPVDMATGRMFIDQVDACLPGSLPLLFTRNFESGYQAGRWMGPRWVCTFDERLEIDAEGVVHVGADRRTQAYPHPEPGEGVQASAGTRRELRLARGGYALCDRSTGLTREFTVTAGGVEALLTRVRDRFGRHYDLAYDEHGVPRSITHSGGYRLLVTVDNHRITALRLAGAGEDGHDALLLRYGYTDGHLTSVYNSSGKPMRFANDANGRILSWTDRNDSQYLYQYDARDRVTDEGGADGSLRFRFTYGAFDPDTGVKVHTETNALGHTTTYHINEHAQVVARIDPLGHTTRYERDAYDRLLTETDPLGRTTRHEYDGAGDLISVIRPDGERITAEYTGTLGLLATITEPGGARWEQTYDDAGRRTSFTDPLGATTRYGYDGLGHLASITDALGGTTLVRCNAAGLPTEVTDPNGATTRYQLDAFGRHVRVTDPLGGVRRLTWTVEGRLTSRALADGATENWTYDGEGNLLTHTDQVGRATTYEYTHFETVAARTGPDGARRTFTHDAHMRLVAVTDALGQEWQYHYDPAGRLVAERDLDGRTVGYQYDAAGQLTSVTNALGERIGYEYDVLGRVSRKDSAGRVTSYGYDPAGHLIRAAGPDAEVVRAVDPVGNVLAETVNGRTLSHHRDLLGRRVRRATPTGHASTWTYDAAGRPTGLATSAGSLDFHYDVAGRETRRTVDGRLTLTSEWDDRHRVIGQAVRSRFATLQRRAFHYRADDHLVGVDRQLGGDRTFELDAAGRITAARGADWSESYAYDAAGNLTDARWPAGGSADAAVGPRRYAGGRVSGAGRVRYEYDTAGRTVLRQRTRLSAKPETWRYTWDAEDRLIEVTVPDGTRWRYLYDPFGRRTAKQRLADDGTTVVEQTDFTWDGARLAEQTTSAPYLPGPHTLSWDHRGMRPITQTEAIRPEGSAPGRVDRRFFAVVTGPEGTPTELIDPASESVAWRAVSTVWGHTTWPGDNTTYTPLRFPGQYFDPETRLSYNLHRYYDAETGRYATPDPLGLAGSAHHYSYVPNPHRWCDPLGLSPHQASGNGPLYSDIRPNGQRGPAYAEVSPQTLADAQAGLIGSEPGRGARWAPPGFVSGQHSRGHLIGRQFGGEGRDMRNIVAQDLGKNNGEYSTAEDAIAKHVRDTQRTITMSATPLYLNGGDVPSHIRLEAVDDFGWSFDQTIDNF